MPVEKLYTLVEETKARLGSSAESVVGYGHLGNRRAELFIYFHFLIIAIILP